MLGWVNWFINWRQQSWFINCLLLLFVMLMMMKRSVRESLLHSLISSRGTAFSWQILPSKIRYSFFWLCLLSSKSTLAMRLLKCDSWVPWWGRIGLRTEFCAKMSNGENGHSVLWGVLHLIWFLEQVLVIVLVKGGISEPAYMKCPKYESERCYLFHLLPNTRKE
jgi:hypothetical protein